ncbi:MAG TPA: prevent-host-death protein [Clostridiales bacterium]|nr:prevent-host-death protein [Clostridiales bacterium]
MLAVNYTTLRENLKSYCDKVSDNGETVIVTRKDEKNVVLISLDEWNDLQRAVRNADYLAKIDRSATAIKEGRIVTKTMEELEAMADE